MMFWVDVDLVSVGDVIHGIAGEDGSEFIFPSIDAVVVHKCPKCVKIQYPFGDTETVPLTAKFYIEEKE